MATLVYSDVDGADRSFALGAEPVLVGRGPECAIRSQDPRVSRTHARFFVEQGALWVEDLGSSNGIYVGPQKVQRAPVPTGEIVLVGSLMIRLLPTSGTLPPPIGLHGTLAQWLEMERRARANLEEERDAFVKRVGELFEEIKMLREAQGVGSAEAEALRAELDQLRRENAAELEIAKLEGAKAREGRSLAETQAGIATAEKLAESDMMIAQLQHQLADAKVAAATSASAGEARAAADQLAAAAGRADKAEKELVAAQIRAQGAERNLAGANTATAKAETRASELEYELSQNAERQASLETELAKTKERLAALETRLGAGDAPLEAAEARAAQLAGDHATAAHELEAAKARISDLEQAANAAASTAGEAEAKVSRAQTEAAAAAAGQAKKLDEAQARIAELETRVRQAGGAEAEIAAAQKAREDARSQLAAAELRVTESNARVDDADKRANAADTMAKAMAKDVAEALRRAADADVKTRTAVRDIDALTKRAETAEAKAALVDEAQAKVVALEKAAVEREQALADKQQRAEKELAERADRLEKEAAGKLQQAQRELAAERQTAMALVDRKTQLERELNDARTQLADVQHRLETANARGAELEVHVEQMEERVQDLESGIAVEQTASASTLEESRARVTKLEEQLGEAKAAAKTAVKTAAGLEKRIDAMETELAAAREAKTTAETALAGLRVHATELETGAEDSIGLREQVATAEQRARDAEASLEPLQAKADAGELASGRANALQRQLDEALQKLAWLERDTAASAGRGADDDHVRELETKLHEVEARAAAAEDHARDATEHARTAEERVERLAGQTREAEAQSRDAEARVQQATQRASEVDARAREIETRAKDAAERIVESDRRAREAQHQLEQAHGRVEELEEQLAHAQQASANGGGNAGLERQLAAAQARIAELVREVDAAENVRQFAASTEREIAQLERELREQKAKLVQLTLERDNLASQLDDLHEDDETAHRRVPDRVAAGPGNDEPTTHADMARYSALVSRASELEAKCGKLEQEVAQMAQLRRALAEAEARAEAQDRAKEDEPTNTGNALPIEFAEHLTMLEEAIDSLKSNMRAASDETAMMDQTESVVAVSSAVSQAAEHVERARDAIRVLGMIVRDSAS
ncbi:MAG TPA: FHA domain-containing protein [Kofleriaceae bacterium]|jgi:chromosome segregation ATPase